MKKILILLYFILPILTYANDNTSQILKIESYKFNELTNSFEQEQYWSAVLIEKNLIYTNAHVILDENDEPIWNYRICKTINFKESPICFSAWELVYYDIKNDLAVLKIVDPKISPVLFSNKSLEIWDSIKVYWYPSNWWNTITYTEWKISWYENWLYKIDANMDAWNSWWWVFDNEWKLVWISVAVVEWYTTLWYIIPIDKINIFKNKTNWDDIIDYKNKISSKFFTYEKMLDRVYSSNNFDNSLITIGNFNKYWYNIDYYEINQDKKFYHLELLDKEWYNWIIIENIKYIWNNSSILDSIVNSYKKELENVKKNENLKIYKIKNIKIKWYNSFLIIKLYDDKSVLITFRIEQDKNHHTEISLYWDSISDKSFNKGLLMILKEINFKNNSYTDDTVWDYFKNSNLSIEKIDWFYVKKDLNTESLKYDLEKDIEVISSSVMEFKETDLNNYTLSSIIKSFYKLMKDSIYINELKVNSTNFEVNYMYVFWINNQFKWKDVVKWANKYFIYATFYDKNNDDKIYQNMIKFSFNDVKSKQIIDNLLKSIKTLSWKNILDLWDIEVWENIILKPEFDFDTWKINKIITSTTNEVKKESTIITTKSETINTNTISSTNKYCSVELDWVIYKLDPCNIDYTMKDWEWDQKFTFKLIPSDANYSYSFSIYWYWEWFPTYGILWWASSWWASGTQFFTKIFTDEVLDKWNYNGYLKIGVYDKDWLERELRLNINLNVE